MDPRLRYNFAKMPVSITEWQGVEIRVIINDPRDQFSSVFSHIIDRNEVQELIHLKRSEDLQMCVENGPPERAHFLLAEWDVKHRAAMRTLETISHCIANALSAAFMKER